MMVVMAVMAARLHLLFTLAKMDRPVNRSNRTDPSTG